MSWDEYALAAVLLGAVVLGLPAYVYVIAKCATAGSMAGRRTFNKFIIRRGSNDGQRQ